MGRKILSKTPTYFKYCSSTLWSSTIISMLQPNRWLSFIECKINEIWRWSCLQKQIGHSKNSVPLNLQNKQKHTKQTHFMLAHHIIGTAECILINKFDTFTDSLEYTYLKENKSLLWALQERGREEKTACFSSLVTSDLFNALWVITKFTTTHRAPPQMLNLRQICGQLCYRSWPSHFGQTDQKSINSTAIN